MFLSRTSSEDTEYHHRRGSLIVKTISIMMFEEKGKMCLIFVKCVQKSCEIWYWKTVLLYKKDSYSISSYRGLFGKQRGLLTSAFSEFEVYHLITDF